MTKIFNTKSESFLDNGTGLVGLTWPKSLAILCGAAVQDPMILWGNDFCCSTDLRLVHISWLNQNISGWLVILLLGVVHKIRWQDFDFFLTTYPPTVTFSMVWTFTKSEHCWTTYLSRLVNVVCEQPLTEIGQKDSKFFVTL